MTPVRFLAIVACSGSLLAAVHADERYATLPEAEALVVRVVAAMQTDKAATLNEITARDLKWVRTDLYPVVYDFNGKCLAHGHNERQVGKQLLDIGDADGKPFIRQRIELARSKGKFLQHYKFTDPVSKRVLPKTSYCEVTGELIVCAGVYRREND